jgi:hypothetical protein
MNRSFICRLIAQAYGVATREMLRMTLRVLNLFFFSLHL